MDNLTQTKIEWLQEIYTDWCEKNNLSLQSADEMIFREEYATEDQRQWLMKFVELWEATQNEVWFN